jgi:hypothetical protein
MVPLASLNKFGIRHGQFHPKKIPVADYNCFRPVNDNDELINKNQYQQAIGSTIHPMVYTRPDIAFALGRLSQYMTTGKTPWDSTKESNAVPTINNQTQTPFWPWGSTSRYCKAI